MTVSIELTERQQHAVLRAVQFGMSSIRADLKDKDYPSSEKPFMRRELNHLMKAYEALLP